MHILSRLRELGLDPASDEARRAVGVVRDRVRRRGWDWDGTWRAGDVLNRGMAPRVVFGGVSSVQIAKPVGLARGTVLKELRAACFPEMAARPRQRQIDPYVPYLRERWHAGEHNARGRWRAIRAQGYSAGEDQVRRVVTAWRADPHHQGNQPPIAAPPAKEEATASSARKTRGLLWKPSSDLTDAHARYVTALTSRCPPIADAHTVLERFRAIVSERQIAQWDAWLEPGERCGICALVGFAQGLRRDYVAVKAALRSEWSQGPVEGHVNRLTPIKRQMYGRAGFALLRRRILTQRSRAP
jgi:transposase